MGILGAVVLLAPPSESRRGTDRPAPAALARDGLAGAGGSPPIFLRSGAEIGPEQAFPGDVKDKGRPAGPAGFGTAAAPSPPLERRRHIWSTGLVAFALPRETPTQSGRCRSGTFTEISAKSPENEKRELVVSRFTLLGHLRPHAGKRGPFLLHGG